MAIQVIIIIPKLYKKSKSRNTRRNINDFVFEKK